MKTKLLMTSTSLILGAFGVFALFLPDTLLEMLNTSPIKSLTILVQLMGALYFAFALMNWTAKDSSIGGIYARPVSLGNFAHFFAGTLLVLRAQLSNEFNLYLFIILAIYTIYAGLFYWLVFHATGLTTKQ